jgi:hypothetical protein
MKNERSEKQGISVPTKIPMEVQIWPIDKLMFYARNPRKNDTAVDRMCGSIRDPLEFACAARQKDSLTAKTQAL